MFPMGLSPMTLKAVVFFLLVCWILAAAPPVSAPTCVASGGGALESVPMTSARPESSSGDWRRVRCMQLRSRGCPAQTSYGGKPAALRWILSNVLKCLVWVGINRNLALVGGLGQLIHCLRHLDESSFVNHERTEQTREAEVISICSATPWPPCTRERKWWAPERGARGTNVGESNGKGWSVKKLRKISAFKSGKLLKVGLKLPLDLSPVHVRITALILCVGLLLLTPPTPHCT